MIFKDLSERSLRNIIQIFCAMLVGIAIIVSVSSYFSIQDKEFQELQNQGIYLSNILDRELDIEVVTIEVLAANAESILSGRQILSDEFLPDIVSSENAEGYTIKPHPGSDETHYGDLIGLGEIPDKGSPIIREMEMATSLSSAFEQITSNSATIHRVYYTSVNRFIYSYPQVREDLVFTNSLFDSAFFSMATPENDPDRSLVWSSPYEDQGGSGQIITISKPIYSGDKFLGVLSLDTRISDLQWLLEKSAPQKIVSSLVNSNGVLIATTGNSNIPSDFSTLTVGAPTWQNEKFVISFPLAEVDWYVVFELDRMTLLARILKGAFFPAVISLTLIFSASLIMVIYRNMRTARYLAIHDGLTGMYNRRGFDETRLVTMQKRFPTDAYLAAAIIDIDYFKKFNDLYGHMAGDEILRRVANSLKNCLRSSADMVFRVGGEEFILLFTIGSADALPHILDRIITGVCELGIPHKKSTFGYVTISAGGMVERLDRLSSLEEAYRRADKALYVAKESGRNRWSIYTEEMDKSI